MASAKTIEPVATTMKAKAESTAWRIRFVSTAPVDAEVLGRFVDPKAAAAVAEAVDPISLQSSFNRSEAMDELDVMIGSLPSGSVETAEAWLNSPNSVDASLPVTVLTPSGQVSWRPGRALIVASASSHQLLRAIAEFAFYEAELRRLEYALPPYEASAMTDTPAAYRMRTNSRDYWSRFGETMESLALLRLTFARLEPRLVTPSRQLPPPSRRLIRQLSRRTAVADRLRAVNDRLQACEDLYEGAIDRITDDRWYRKGHLLELIIVVLLAIEVVQLAGDIAIRWASNHAR